MKKEVKNLNTKKSGTFMNITPKLLQETLDIIVEPLAVSPIIYQTTKSQKTDQKQTTIS